MAFTDIGREYSDTFTSEDVPCNVRIGGETPDRFEPVIRSSKHDDEFWMNVRHPDRSIITSEVETFRDGRIELVVGDRTHRYYQTDEGKLEYEIVFDKRPETNLVVLDIELARGMYLVKQDTIRNHWLAEEEWNTERRKPVIPWDIYNDGSNRPDEVVGSYVIWNGLKNGRYKTGKFGIIEAPYLIDSNRTRVKAEQEWHEATGLLIITLPWDFLNSAVYPLILDPILGYDTAGSSDWGFNNITVGSSWTTDGTGGAINSYHCAVESVGSLAGVKMAVYECEQSDGSPDEHDRVEAYVEWDVSVSDDESTSSIGSGSLSASTKYHIAWQPEDSGTDVKYDDDASYEGYYRTGQVYADELVTPYDNGSTGNTRGHSIWIDYGGGGGGISIPVAMHHFTKNIGSN